MNHGVVCLLVIRPAAGCPHDVGYRRFTEIPLPYLSPGCTARVIDSAPHRRSDQITPTPSTSKRPRYRTKKRFRYFDGSNHAPTGRTWGRRQCKKNGDPQGGNQTGDHNETPKTKFRPRKTADNEDFEKKKWLQTTLSSNPWLMWLVVVVIRIRKELRPTSIQRERPRSFHRPTPFSSLRCVGKACFKHGLWR